SSLIQEVLVLRNTFAIEIDCKVQMLLGQSALLGIVSNAREIKLEGNTTTRKSFKNCFRLRLQLWPNRIDRLIETCNGVVDPRQRSATVSFGEAIKYLLPELPNGCSRTHRRQWIVG